MHNLYPNPINYLGRSFSYILEYLQTSNLSNIPNVILTNCNVSGFLHQTMSHNNSICNIILFIYHWLIWYCPHVYTTSGYTNINNVTILFHISIARSQLHKQCLTISIRFVQKRANIVYIHPFSPTINYYSSMNQQP